MLQSEKVFSSFYYFYRCNSKDRDVYLDTLAQTILSIGQRSAACYYKLSNLYFYNTPNLRCALLCT